MPNVLLATNVSGGDTTVAALPLFDPRLVRLHRQRLRFDSPPELAHANSFACPSGRWPARGWVLLRRGDYDQITNAYRTDFALQVDDLANGPVTLQNLSLVQARCVTRGVAADPDAIYLVELTDLRGVLWNPWAKWPVFAQYNLPAPAYPGQYYADSTPGGAGTPWTWDALVGDLWGRMPLLGPFPGLPVTPSGTPDGYSFPGESCWEALNQVLDLLGLVVSADLTQDDPYGIAVYGADDGTAELQERFLPGLEEDYEYIDGGAGRVPGGVVVYFHRANQYYGTEETVRRDGLQWQTGSAYAVPVSGPSPFTNSPGTQGIWDDFPVRFDIDGNPLAADTATAAAIAAERANQYYTRVTRGLGGYLYQVYAGALPFFSGAALDGVRWWETGLPDRGPRAARAAWRTTVVRGAEPPWELLGMGVPPHG